ncbi:acylphosphatase [Thalassobacillus hwangdonensis]|uniref:acylphosphatase n=1 Tax=Thalassobacillus hwangdonensis TaxID=546108 RepID=A0ABW3L5X9_9BACI
MNSYPDWLTEQMINGVNGFNIDSFLLALEGWRRGLNLKFYQNPEEHSDLGIIGYDPAGKFFSLSDQNNTHYFYRSRGDKVKNETVDIGTNKGETKKRMQSAGLPVPQGFEFTSGSSTDEVLEEASALGFPLVLKPTFGSLGKGVITNIQSTEELQESIADVKKAFPYYRDFIVEEHAEGVDVRVYVIEDEIAGATKRVRPNVTGDGKSTIEALIHLKNETRKANPHTATRLIKLDEHLQNYLARQNKGLQTIPDEGELIYVKGNSNISSGGDSVDITEDLPAHVKKIAVDAVKAVDGLVHAGVDLLMKEDEATTIEINPTAGIALHTFPLYGEKQNIAEKIIDYYFPSTKAGSGSVSKLIYFDYKNVLRMIRSNFFKMVEIPDAPRGPICAKRYVVSGKVQKVGYRNWIRKHAIENGLHGYTRNLNNGNVVVVVAGDDEDKVEGFKDFCWQGPSGAKVEKILEYEWNTQVKVGFEIRNTKKK